MPSKKYPTGSRKLAPKRRRNPSKRRAKRSGPLAPWIKASGKTLTHIAEDLGISVQHVSNLLHGHTKPSRELAVAIERATGGVVVVASWG